MNIKYRMIGFDMFDNVDDTVTNCTYERMVPIELSIYKLTMPTLQLCQIMYACDTIRCGLMMPYYDAYLGEHWLRHWLHTWLHKAIA